jgi:hypothetical protein
VRSRRTGDRLAKGPGMSAVRRERQHARSGAWLGHTREAGERECLAPSTEIPLSGPGNEAGLDLRFSGELIRDGLRSRRGGQAWRSD